MPRIIRVFEKWKLAAGNSGILVCFSQMACTEQLTHFYNKKRHRCSAMLCRLFFLKWHLRKISCRFRAGKRQIFIEKHPQKHKIPAQKSPTCAFFALTVPMLTQPIPPFQAKVHPTPALNGKKFRARILAIFLYICSALRQGAFSLRRSSAGWEVRGFNDF